MPWLPDTVITFKLGAWCRVSESSLVLLAAIDEEGACWEAVCPAGTG